MCYMMSKQQYLNDDGMRWHPHLMFFVPGDAAKSWGADLPGSPVIAANDPEERVTIMMVPVGNGPMGRRPADGALICNLMLPSDTLALRAFRTRDIVPTNARDGDGPHRKTLAGDNNQPITEG